MLTIYGVTSHILRNPYLNGKQVANNKRLINQEFHLSKERIFDELLSPSLTLVDGSGTTKESKMSHPSRISTDFDLQQVLFHYKLLSIIISSSGV